MLFHNVFFDVLGTAFFNADLQLFGAETFRRRHVLTLYYFATKEHEFAFLTPERSEGVLFECIGYSIKVATRHGPARNRSRICEANIFFYFCTD